MPFNLTVETIWTDSGAQKLWNVLRLDEWATHDQLPWQEMARMTKTEQRKKQKTENPNKNNTYPDLLSRFLKHLDKRQFYKPLVNNNTLSKFHSACL